MKKTSVNCSEKLRDSCLKILLPGARFPRLNLYYVGIEDKVHGRIQRGDRGSRPHWKITKIYRVFCNTGPDPLENQKATKPAFHDGPLSGRQRNAIYTEFR